MVLLHGGSPKGAELIAAKWASNRKVTQIPFKPDWTKHAKAAPFKRNDAMLAVMPIVPTLCRKPSRYAANIQNSKANYYLWPLGKAPYQACLTCSV